MEMTSTTIEENIKKGDIERLALYKRLHKLLGTNSYEEPEFVTNTQILDLIVTALESHDGNS